MVLAAQALAETGLTGTLREGDPIGPYTVVRELGEIVTPAGTAVDAAMRDAGISVFDSTGVAVQDVAVAEMAYRALEVAGGGGGDGSGAAPKL